MAIAGAIIIPRPGIPEQEIIARLTATPGVDSCESGPRGIAVVLEATDTQKLEKLSGRIKAMEEVIDLQLAYLNWEDEVDDRDVSPEG